MCATTAAVPVSQMTSRRMHPSEKVYLGILSLVYLVIAMRSAYLRPFWFDELSTYFMTRTPTLRSMFQAMPTDGNPPLYFLLARPLLHLPIRMELAMRIPAIIAYLVTALTIYWFVRRDASRVFAFLSIGFFLGCSIHRFAIEARAYSLMMAFTGVTICCWQSYCRTGKRAALAGISLGVAGAILSHQYGVIYALFPVGAGELVRSVRLRRTDVRPYLAGLLGALFLLLTVPPMLRGQKLLLSAIRSCPSFHAYPKWSDLKLYGAMLPPFFFLIVLLACFALVLKIATNGNIAHEKTDSPPEDFAVAAALTLFLPLMLLVTHFGTNFFQVRYGIGSAMGLSILAGLLLARLRWRYAANAAWVGSAYGFSVGLLGLWFGAVPGIVPWNDPILRGADSQQPIVVASALEFSPMWWYSANRQQLHYLSDLRSALQHSDIIPEYSLYLERNYTPMQMEDYRAFVNSHPRFLLYCFAEPRLEWVKLRLLDEGWRLTLLKSAKKESPPDDDEDYGYRELYEVSR